MKKRYFPDKKQNNYGGDYECTQYDKRISGDEWCHNEGNSNWNEFIEWAQNNKDGKLKCKGNRHNCMKLRQKWLASLSNDEKEKHLKN